MSTATAQAVGYHSRIEHTHLQGVISTCSCAQTDICSGEAPRYVTTAASLSAAAASKSTAAASISELLCGACVGSGMADQAATSTSGEPVYGHT